MKLSEILLGSPESHLEKERRREIHEIDTNTFMVTNGWLRENDGARVIPNSHDSLPMTLPGELVVDLTNDELLAGLDVGILTVDSISKRQLEIYMQYLKDKPARQHNICALKSLLQKVSENHS